MRAPRPSRSQLGTGALIVSALALGQVLNDRLPDGSDSTRPFEREVAIGATTELRTGDLTPVSVDGARSILRDLDASIRSPGVVVVLHFDFVSRGEASNLAYGELRDGSGRVTAFSNSGNRNKVTCPSGPVGIVVHCTAVVEADPGTLPGSTLALAHDALDTRFDDMAVVDLDIDGDDVAAWRTVEGLEVRVTSVEGMA